MRTNVSVRAVIIRDDKILLIHRIKNDEEYYVTPGGGVEEGESIQEALKREIKEETNLDLGKFEKWYEETYEGVQTLYFICQVEGNEIKIIGEELDKEDKNNHYEPRWVNKRDLKKVTVYPEKIKELAE
jgi:8-oxo-dGTP pyrophosphatase MutT (NUDIX family)